MKSLGSSRDSLEYSEESSSEKFIRYESYLEADKSNLFSFLFEFSSFDNFDKGIFDYSFNERECFCEVNGDY